MKNFLVPLLCAIPLIANAVNVGGFEFNKDGDSVIPGKVETILEVTIDDAKWVGTYDGLFELISKARGKNKVWYMLSARKGNVLASPKDARSLLYLIELDCEEYRSRVLQAQAYPGYFLTSFPFYFDYKYRGWEYQRDSDNTMKLGCKLIKEASKTKQKILF